MVAWLSSPEHRLPVGVSIQPSRVGLTSFSKNISINFAANGVYSDVEVLLVMSTHVVNCLSQMPALLVCIALEMELALRLHAD